MMVLILNTTMENSRKYFLGRYKILPENPWLDLVVHMYLRRGLCEQFQKYVPYSCIV